MSSYSTVCSTAFPLPEPHIFYGVGRNYFSWTISHFLALLMSCKWWRVLENRATERGWWFLSELGKTQRNLFKDRKGMCLPFALASAVSRHSFMCLMVTAEPRGESSHSVMPHINASLRHLLQGCARHCHQNFQHQVRQDPAVWFFGLLKTKSWTLLMCTAKCL